MPINQNLNFEILETELQKRLIYPYNWQRIQNDIWDKSTSFIYKTFNFEDLITQIKIHFNNLKTETSFVLYFNYALNRWYNFWSAKAVEMMFTQCPKVTAHKDPYDKQIDFWIDNIPFDHKTSVFPKGFGKSFTYAQQHSKALTKWFYDKQSQQGRQHFKNRLFVVLYKKDGAHWQLKADLNLIKNHVEKYLQNFMVGNLINHSFKTENKPTLTDVIFVVK
jgi:hypothetical protein